MAMMSITTTRKALSHWWDTQNREGIFSWLARPYKALVFEVVDSSILMVVSFLYKNESTHMKIVILFCIYCT